VKTRWLVLLIVSMLFLIGVASLQAQDDAATVMLGGNDELGAFLTDAEGMTLYWFANDEPGVTNCYDQCATNWPPLTVGEDEAATLATGIPGMVGVIERTDGTRQVTYNGMPLYYWKDDMAPGDATGHLVGDVWFAAMAPAVGLGGNADLGSFLVGSNGLTLYTFDNDEPGVSNCYDQCATNWPPLTVESADALTMQPGLGGEFSTVERTDGTHQVAYNGMPLYYWKDDMAPGDATGQGVGDVWWVAAPMTLDVRENEEFGNILVGPSGMTLYTFANDEPGVTNCYDQCAVNWPPLLVGSAGESTVAEGVMGEVGVTERTDGTMQVTYNGMPLYYWIRDVVPGDTTGHNVGDVWFVATP
jgi:predicted lipoprotein with Yx(FWY)xxD motif